MIRNETSTYLGNM